MDVAAWCGRCGQSFALREFLDDGTATSCPRCGAALAPGYAAVAAGAARQLLAAAAALTDAGARLRDIAPGLHIDAGALATSVTAALGRPEP